MDAWTRFRGPNGSGVGSDTTVSPAFAEKDVKWRASLPGEGHSSPVISGSQVFVTAAENERGKRHLLSLNTKTGKEIWRQSFDFKTYHTHELNTAASSTPTVDAERVYSLWSAPEGFLAVAHSLGGKEVWRRELGAFETQHGGASSPILEGGLVIFAREPENGDGSLLALDAKTGRTVWEVKRASRDAPYSVPMLLSPGQLIFSSTAHGVTCLDPKTGKLLWEMPDLFRYRCVGSPIVAGGNLVATSGVGNGSRLTVALKPGGGKPSVAWSLTRGTSYVPTPIAASDLLFLWGDGGIVTCVRPDSGMVVWQERVGGTFYGSPVLTSGKLWAVSAKGELVVLAASSKFEVLGRKELGAPSQATPAISENTIYLRTVRQLIALGGK